MARSIEHEYKPITPILNAQFFVVPIELPYLVCGLLGSGLTTTDYCFFHYYYFFYFYLSYYYYSFHYHSYHHYLDAGNHSESLGLDMESYVVRRTPERHLEEEVDCSRSQEVCQAERSLVSVHTFLTGQGAS